MRVFVAGASGVIGSRLVPKLVSAGHEVTAMTRTDSKAAPLREAGATAVTCDVFDEAAVRDAMQAAGPEVVVHQLTAFPEDMDFEDPATFAPTNSVRTEGTRILIEGARAAGARRFVAQSVAFVRDPSGDWVKDEEAPIWTDPPDSFREAVAAVRELEDRVTGAEGLEGVVLRYGYFYGPGTQYAADGPIAELVRKRRFPVVGGGRGTMSFIHVDDAADATVAALERGAAGAYNVVDDEPAPVREWLPEYAEELGAKKPLRAPRWMGRMVAGPTTVAFLTELRGASNARAKRELGWSPGHPSWRGQLAGD